MGKNWKLLDFIFLGSQITANSDYNHEIKRRLLFGRKAMTNLDSVLKSRDITLPTKVRLVKALIFPVVMYELWELDHKEGWAPKNWYFWIMVLEKTLESPFNSKEIKPVHPEGNQPWIFIGRTDAEANAPILGHLMGKAWKDTWKDSDSGKDWRHEKKWSTGWGGWMASPTQRTWVWANSGR